MDFSVAVVLPAAGCGERMGLPVPKQFCKILGRPLISYTIEAFERLSFVGNIIIVTPATKRNDIEEILKAFGHSSRIHIADGASVRHRSIYNGLLEFKKVSGGPPEVVIIHDAVRPFVDEETVKSVALAAQKHGSAGAIRPLISTVIASDSNGFLEHSLDRTKYRASEMPQGFKYDVIKMAYDRCTDYDFDYGTECLHLVDKYVGIKAQLVEGADNLWKVTLRKDLYAAEGIILEAERVVQLHKFTENLEVTPLLTKEFTNFDFKVQNDSKLEDTLLKKSSHHVIYFGGPEYIEESNVTDLMPASSLLIVVKSTDLVSRFPEVHQKLKDVTRKYPRCSVNAVLFQETSNLKEVCEFVVSLLHKRNTNINGQVLIC